MTSNAEIKRQQATLPKPSAIWVHEVLEPDQLTRAKHSLGRQVLSRRTLFLLWGLRVYVVLMVLLVALQTWNAFHTARR
jgi:hypothetical protein